MKLAIKVSPRMEQEKSPLGSIEDRLIRIPNKVREEFGLSPGLFLCFKKKNGQTISLQISTAYKSDVEKDDTFAYVSSATYNILDIEKINYVRPADDILIGCDPEFFIVEQETNRIVSAAHFFPHYGEVGNDCGLAELRPRPSFNEPDLSANIHKLLERANSHLSRTVLLNNKNVKMVASSWWNNAPAGYHIHFGLPLNLLRTTPENNLLLSYLVNILDYYVGISAILPEGSEDYKRRYTQNGRYGKPGDHRYGTMTLEYRVPGGHLLRHPILSSGILAISKVVMKDILSRLKIYSNGFKKKEPFKSYKSLRELYPNLPSRSIVYNSIVSKSTGLAFDQLDKIFNDLSLMIGYKENQDAIIAYFNYVLDYALKIEKFSEDIEMNWRLKKNEEQPRQMAVLQASI